MLMQKELDLLDGRGILEASIKLMLRPKPLVSDPLHMLIALLTFHCSVATARSVVLFKKIENVDRSIELMADCTKPPRRSVHPRCPGPGVPTPVNFNQDDISVVLAVKVQAVSDSMRHLVFFISHALVLIGPLLDGFENRLVPVLRIAVASKGIDGVSSSMESDDWHGSGCIVRSWETESTDWRNG
mmetsp:Transcript_34420/g.67860  ORF Transcript_34420/g.67860 Transcript_34420/m.67860 type:complete len:186 (-) Transcript_34420:439-996(-)